MSVTRTSPPVFVTARGFARLRARAWATAAKRALNASKLAASLPPFADTGRARPTTQAGPVCRTPTWWGTAIAPREPALDRTLAAMNRPSLAGGDHDARRAGAALRALPAGLSRTRAEGGTT